MRLSAAIGPDAWDRAEPNRAQPIMLSLKLYIDTRSAGDSDNIRDTFSYSNMCKDVFGQVDGASFATIDDLARCVGELMNGWPGKMLKMVALAPKAVLRAQGGLAKQCVWERKAEGDLSLHSHAWRIKDLQLACIIGVNPHERLEKQTVIIDLRIVGKTEPVAYQKQMTEGRGTWAGLVKRVCAVSCGVFLPPEKIYLVPIKLLMFSSPSYRS